MFDQLDPRSRDDDTRDVEMPWVELGRELASDGRENDVRERDDRDRDRDSRHREFDPRDAFVHGLDLPRGHERELVLDGRDRYELNGDESRSLATIGAFRVASESDLRDAGNDSRGGGLEHLRDQGLVRFVSLDGRDRAVTLTERGRHLLDANRNDRSDREQSFYAGISKPRELSHDAQLYRAYVREAERLHKENAEVRGVTLEEDLKREYQEWLQAHNQGRSDSDGRPDRDADEIEEWAREHHLPYFDESVHFPDFRIEYEDRGLELYRDVEVVTEHYRGAHASSRVRSGFSCHGTGHRGGGHPFDPDIASRFL